MPLLLAPALLAAPLLLSTAQADKFTLKPPKGAVLSPQFHQIATGPKKMKVALYPLWVDCEVPLSVKADAMQGLIDGAPIVEKEGKIWPFVQTATFHQKLKPLGTVQHPESGWVNGPTQELAKTLGAEYTGAIVLKMIAYGAEGNSRTCMVMGKMYLRDLKTNKPFDFTVYGQAVAKKEGSNKMPSPRNAVYDMVANRLLDPMKGGVEEEIIR